MNKYHRLMELQQLRYVVALAEERNFTRAAERCSVVQSALSHQIKALETEVGVALFARTSRRVNLTTAGEAFLASARASLDAAERAAADAAAAVGDIRGTLTIGAIPTVTALDLPATLGDFHRAHPSVRVTVRSGASDDFITAIADGRLDLAVLGVSESAPPVRVETRELARERLVAVVSTRHRLAHRQRLRLRDLAHETFVDFPAQTPGRAQSDLAFRTTDVPRDVAFETMSTDLILGLVRQNLAVALLAPDVALGEDLRLIPVTDGPTRVQYLAWSSFNPSPATRAFLAVVPKR